MSSERAVRMSELPDAARDGLARGDTVSVEAEGVQVATIIPAATRPSGLMSLAGALRFEGRLDPATIDAELDRRAG